MYMKICKITATRLGGEQSGHIIFMQSTPQQVAYLLHFKVMEVVLETKQPLSKLASEVDSFPCSAVLKNVRVTDKKIAGGRE